MKTQLFKWEDCIGKTVSQIKNQLIFDSRYDDENWFECVIILFTDDTFIFQYTRKDRYGANEIHIDIDQEYYICDGLPFDELVFSKQEIKIKKRQIKETLEYEKRNDQAYKKLQKAGLCLDVKITNKSRQEYYKKLDKVKLKKPKRRRNGTHKKEIT